MAGIRDMLGLGKSKRKASRKGRTKKDNQRLDKVERAVDLLEQSLSKVMPGIVISVAEDSGQFALFADEQKVKKKNRSQGLFTQVDGTYVIVLNPDSTDVTTVFHEGLHAALRASGLSEAEARAVTGRMIEAVKKTATKRLQRELKGFTEMYETREQNEEYIAELIGILANNYNEQDNETKSIIRRWLQKLADILGLKPKGVPLSSVGLNNTDAATVNMLNVLAEKMSRGKALSKEDVTALRMGGPLTSRQVMADMRMDEEQGGSGQVGNFNFKRKKSKAPSVEDDTRSYAKNTIQKDLTTYAGQNFLTNMYDFTDSGKKDIGGGIVLDLYGGKNYPALMMERTGTKFGEVSNIAAFNSKENAEGFIKNAIDGKANLFAPHVGTKEGSWQFQQNIFEQLVEKLLDNNVITNEELIESFNSGLNSKDGKEALRIFNEKNKTNLTNLNDFIENPKKLVELLDIDNNYSADLRKILNDKIAANKKVQKFLGVTNKIEFAELLEDPMNVGSKPFDLIGLIEFDNTTFEKPSRPKKGDADYHPSFAWTVKAKIKAIVQPTYFYQSTESTDSYTKFNQDGVVVSRLTDLKDSKGRSLEKLYKTALKDTRKYKINEQGKKVIESGKAPFDGTFEDFQKSKFKSSNVASSAGSLPKVATVKPIIRKQKRIDSASKKLKTLFDRDNVQLTIPEAKEMVAEVYDWTTWYDELSSYVNDLFGEYGEDVLSILPLSSMAANSAATVGMAINNVERIYKGDKPKGVAEYYGYVTDFLEGKGIKSDKMYNFFKALSGDKNAVAVDMHVYSIIMGKDPNKKQVNPANKKEFDRAKEFVNTLATELELAPREVQAALWALNILRTGGKPDSYEQYFEKQVKSKNLEQRIEGWRKEGYKPFSEIRKTKEQQISEENAIRKQKRRTNKDLKNNWLPTPIKSMRNSTIAKSKEVMQRAAIKLLKGEITQEKWVEVREKNSPINKIGNLFQASTLEHMNIALGKKVDKLMAPVPKDIIKRVGARLDIPSYLDHNAWVVTLHDGKGPVISYRNAVRLKNVEFVTNPNSALMIASGLKDKSTFARMVGEMVDIPGNTAEEQGLEAQFMIEDIMNNKEWTQVGMNPFRQSWFWNRENGNPVVAADEIIQVGGLVYAKNITEASPNDKRFEVKGRLEPTTKDGKTSYKLNQRDFPDERITDPEGRTVKFSRTKPKSNIKDVFEYGFKKGFSAISIKRHLIKLGYTKEEVDSGAYDAEKVFNKNGKKVSVWLGWIRRKALSARSFMPKTMFMAMEVMNSSIDAESSRARKTVNKVISIINKLENEEQKERAEELLNKYLTTGGRVGSEEKAKVLAELEKEFGSVGINIGSLAFQMRTHIDSLTEKLIASGMIKADESVQNIKDNIGIYMNRSFEVFDNKNWKNIVSQQVIDEAKNYLRISFEKQMLEKNAFRKNVENDAKENGVSIDEQINILVDNKVNEILSKSEANDYISQVTSQKKIGAQNLTALQRRKDIPLEIRALMGEYSSPSYNYAISVYKIANLVAKQKFQNTLIQQAKGVWLFEKGQIKPSDYKEIKGESMGPLQGLYAPPEVISEFNNAFDPKEISKRLKVWLTLVGLVKYSKTILSFGTHFKNVFGNLYFMAQNGYLFKFNEFQKAFDLLKNDFNGKATIEMQEKLDEYVRAGFIGQGASIGEIKAMFKSTTGSFENSLEQRISRKSALKSRILATNIAKKIKRFGKGAQQLYQYEDDMFKIVAYEAEKKRYSQATYGKTYDNLSDFEKSSIDSKVEEIVKNILPNYGRIGGLGKFLKGFPVAGTFISFQLESYRTAANTITLATNEILSENKEIKKIGAKRLAATIGVQTFKFAVEAVATGLAMSALSEMGGDDDDEDEDDNVMDAVKSFLPSWDKNSQIILSDLGNGKFKYRSISASDPYGTQVRVFKAIYNLIKNRDVESAKNALYESGSLLSPDILLTKVVEILNNENSYGGKIYNEDADNNSEKTWKAFKHLWQAFEPGTMTSVKKVVNPLLDYKEQNIDDKMTLKQLGFDTANELLGQATGFKSHTVDVSKQAYYKFQDINEQATNIKQAYYKEKHQFEDGKIDQEEYDKLTDRREKELIDVYNKAISVYKNATILGVESDKLSESMGVSGKNKYPIAKKIIRQIVTGEITDTYLN